jgi:TonB family protein
MEATELLQTLLQATIATSGAVLLVLAIRRLLRAGFGARVAYMAWALVPASLLAVLLPAAPAAFALPVIDTVVLVPASGGTIDAGFASGASTWIAVAWCVGAAAAAGLLAAMQRRFRIGLGRLVRHHEGLQAASSAGLPATMGWLRPVVVLPVDFDSRYDAHQRALMLAHERMHIVRGDLHANAVAAVLRCLFWFNPLLHVAARRFHHDQELACDACVVAAAPGIRRVYGETLLQAQFVAQGMSVGCHFGFGHPLKERVAMLKESLPSPARRIAGGTLVASLVLGVAFAAWGTQPREVVQRPDLDVYVKRVSTETPAYPEAAREQRISGNVILVVDVAEDGSVASAEVERSEPAGVFDEAALSAVANWKFEPAMKGGKAVPSRVRVPIAFEIPPKAPEAG